jgi:hypothetical protein
LSELTSLSDKEVLGHLVHDAVRQLDQTQDNRQIQAWEDALPILRQMSTDVCALLPSAHDWVLVLEFEIPRRGKRIDAVVLAGKVIFVIEFKVGTRRREQEAVRQTEDYALELRDFHAGSSGRALVPVLCPTEFQGCELAPYQTESPLSVTTCGAPSLAATLVELHQRVAPHQVGAVVAQEWLLAPYRPTPTIIEAAQALFAGHDVRAIAQSEASAKNLHDTQDAVARAVETARTRGRKVVCFVTGVPGAGKTLAGLNIVHQFKSGEATFLSGNTPLVKVLRKALAKDASGRQNTSLGNEQRTAETFIANVHHWLDEYIDKKPMEAPAERVVCFDEAQRAWNRQHSRRKFKRDASEPSMILRVLDRHPNWGVLVALIGNGQEINTGEAGLAEWGRALAEEFPHWDVYLSPRLMDGQSSSAFEQLPPALLERARTDGALNLDTPVRSFRADRLTLWVNAVLAGETERARELSGTLTQYPLYITRDIETARAWLRKRARGLRRSGLVATSGARRLRPHGIEVKLVLEPEEWFLTSSDDVRSSSFLELAATEFAIQGLELDWAGLCWDADLRWEASTQQWVPHQFKGTAWTKVRAAEIRQYVINKYRVLLTRAREGLVIWVPHGSELDRTRPVQTYDAIYNVLCECGVKVLSKASL